MLKVSCDLTGFAEPKSKYKAYDDSTYDGEPKSIGVGPTEISAVLDLVAKIIDNEPNHPSYGMGGGLMREAQIKTCQRLSEAVRDLAHDS